ncbi:MAG TPA: oxygenase MpaB family protein [Nocardioidaceae bacterium]|nr:oxygenase MpaB family protein [Nocardioidaceae bacterium]
MSATATPPKTDDFDILDHFDGAVGGLGGVANVIMQLAHPAVGYGVYESKVDNGSAMKHPYKRARTTGTFLAVALVGTEDDKRAMREAINSQHRHVYSTEKSPVKYNAFSRDLQLWVAACLYKGTADLIEYLHGAPDEATQDTIYAHCASFGTTLQVQPEMWPADRAAFQEYWDEQESKVVIDDTIRSFLMGLVMLVNVAWPLRVFAPLHRWFVTAFLPQAFRDQMHLTWTEKDQRRFLRVMRGIGWVTRKLPQRIRNWPVYLNLWDLRRRVRTGRPLV